MTAPRTISVPTLDHGPIPISEPAWCTGHTDHQPGYRVDLTHTGLEHPFAFEGEVLLVAMLTQAPFTETGSPETGLYIEQTGYARTLDPTELTRLAAAFVVYATHLRTLERQLSAIKAGEAR
ncbi:hypothetical protein ABZ498_06500 [Streptomyces lavendulocolor]|uniref:DUF6907 domain-containing protein n=1 Tax=Streptomyces lavendulocolor TaxID=67316 RepID=UPI0033F4500A